MFRKEYRKICSTLLLSHCGALAVSLMSVPPAKKKQKHFWVGFAPLHRRFVIVIFEGEGAIESKQNSAQKVSLIVMVLRGSTSYTV